MRVIAAPLAVVCGIAAAGAAVGGVSGLSPLTWPESGVVKISAPKSPPYVSIKLENCCSVSLDWESNQVLAKDESGDQEREATATGGNKMVPHGGRFVALLMLEENKMNVVVNAEAEGGEFSTRTLRLPVETCPLSKLTISSPDKAEKLDANVSVSQEIETLLRSPPADFASSA